MITSAKFRGNVYDGEGTVKGGILFYNSMAYIIDSKKNFTRVVNVCEYIGLKDKNECEVYEDDYIKLNRTVSESCLDENREWYTKRSEAVSLFQVKRYKYGEFRLELIRSTAIGDEYNHFDMIHTITHGKVVGNCHEDDWLDLWENIEKEVYKNDRTRKARKGDW